MVFDGWKHKNRDILITYRYHMGVPIKNNRQNSANDRPKSEKSLVDKDTSRFATLSKLCGIFHIDTRNK